VREALCPSNQRLPALPAKGATMTTTTEHTQALELHAKLLTVNEGAVPVISRDRSLPRKELAALVRRLFRQLGLKGISVTAPNYSMAQAIDIRLPRREDNAGVDGFHDATTPGALANNRAHLAVREILARACPQDDDRSDSQSDYFNFRFMIS
jgi:hypothetical protein